MKRAAMLFCANIDAPRYKVLRQRGQLPFGHSDDSPDNKWADFTLDDAFRLRLALDLIGGESADSSELNGLGPSYAASIVFNALSYVEAQALQEDTKRDLWIGVGIFDEINAEGEDYRWSNWFAGGLSQVATWVAEKESDGTASNSQGVRFFLVNATRAANFVRERAKELGLPEAEDFTAVK
jgi:hypothetical protein